MTGYADGPVQPAHLAMGLAERFWRRIRERDAQLRVAFVEQRDPKGPDPMLATMMRRGGRGGGLRLKLFLSVLWIAVGEEHEVRYPARVWAELIGLPDPGGNGARRISATFRALEELNLVRGAPHSGRETVYRLLDERGTGGSYAVPGARIAALRAAEQAWEPHRYIKVPATLWRNGWMTELSGPAVAMLLVLLTHAGGNYERELWFSPQTADDRFRLSEDTRRRGLHELDDAGIVRTHRRPLRENSFASPRLRNTYTLRPGTLEKPAR
jgi:hypothetical protein